jgi:hypothetical protein
MRHLESIVQTSPTPRFYDEVGSDQDVGMHI